METAKDPGDWLLYVVTDERFGRSHLEVARAAIAGGADVVQLRDKSAPAGRLYETALEMSRLARAARVPLIVNDRVDIALASGADGVHIGQDDLPAAAARQLVGEAVLVGVSATTLEEAMAAERDGADYIGFGPVFEARGTKPDTVAPLGVELLREVCRHCRVPVIAIGGLDGTNVEPVIAAGASGVAVMSSVVAAGNIAAAARGLREKIEQAVRSRRGRPVREVRRGGRKQCRGR